MSITAQDTEVEKKDPVKIILLPDLSRKADENYRLDGKVDFLDRPFC